MSKIRPWTNGDQVALDAAGKVPVSVGDSTGAEWVLNNGGMPTNTNDGDGVAIGSSSTVGASLDVGLHDSAGAAVTVDAGGNLPVSIGDATGNVMTLETNGSVPVTIQDQTSPTLIVPLSQVSNTTTVSTLGVIDTNTILVTSATGFVDGVFIVIADLVNDRYYTGYQVGAIAGTTVTLDTPLDFAYAVGATITNGVTNMNVDGSVTHQVFGLRVSDPGLPLTVDVTRLMFLCTTATAVDFSTFGDIAGGITNGIVVRRRDGTFNNIFNAKTNGDLAGIMYDFTVAAATNPQQGQDGFIGRLTFAGQNKMGVTIRVGPSEDLECIIQDDLTGITSLSVIAEGSVVI